MQNNSGLILLKKVFNNNYYNKIDFLKMIFLEEQINQLESKTDLNELLIDLKQLLNNQIINNQNKIKEHQLELKQTHRKILNKLWLWWLIPLIGMFIFLLFIILNYKIHIMQIS
uniref:Uncharacterized protein n=1 Tax=Mycoplasma feriruminatoris TaxID=1179777 RepID=A0A654IL62_9MOLU|nr:hypothetical protein MF5582_00117 [Mycoplasma feriruminatoris]